MDTEAVPDPLRIILVGKTHAGKSSTGNTICGKEVFKIKTTEMDASKCIFVERTNFSGQPLSIVDTPGLFDPSKSNEEVKRAIANGVAKSAPGPHAILVIIRPGKFTNEEQEAVCILQTIFGEKAARYTMALFTCGDDLETDGVLIEDVIHQSSHLRTFINQCGGGYHVFNNRVKDPSQVSELLEKINTMVLMNGGSYYTKDLPPQQSLEPEGQDGFDAAFAIGRAIGGVGAAAAVAAGGVVGTLAVANTGGAVVAAVTVGVAVGFIVCVGGAAAVVAFAAVGAAAGGAIAAGATGAVAIAASMFADGGEFFGAVPIAVGAAAGAASGVAAGAASVGRVAVKAAGAAGVCGAVVAAGATAVAAAVEAEIVGLVGVAAAVVAVQTAAGAVKDAAAAASAFRAGAVAPSTGGAVRAAPDAVGPGVAPDVPAVAPGVAAGAAGAVCGAVIAVGNVLKAVGAFGTADKILSVAFAAVTAILPVAYLTKTLWLNRNN